MRRLLLAAALSFTGLILSAPAQADNCTYFSGPFVNNSQCQYPDGSSYQCNGGGFGIWSFQNCTYVPPDPQLPIP